jgi:hypothetical protein
MGLDWGYERVDYLKKLWCEDGLSGSICAQRLTTRFGFTITRNAVIAKVHRERWPKRKHTSSHEERRPARSVAFKAQAYNTERPKQMSEGTELRVKRKARQAVIVKALLRDPVQVAAPVSAERHTCDSLPPNQCKWIYGDPRGHKEGPLYCTNLRFEDATGKRWSYCAHHCTIAHPGFQEAAEEAGVAPQKEHAHV